ncbi:MAG: hypothetical protein IJI71_03100 [Clostridia bacterium]|nr:hypothetical protein [Clostridia bacterium]
MSLEKRSGPCPFVRMPYIKVSVSVSNGVISGIDCPMFNADVSCTHITDDKKCDLFPEYGVADGVKPAT